jgi:S-adenosylmethionine synthetase
LKRLAVLSAIHEQSADINQGVDRANPEMGAGDQGMMFGYATNETEITYFGTDLSHKLLQELAILRRENNEIPICQMLNPK